MYLEIAGGSHLRDNSPTDERGQVRHLVVKRFVDNDDRYTQFLCPTPAAVGDISAYQSNCPYTD